MRYTQLSLEDSARRSDPTSSHRAVQAIVRNGSLAEHIIRYAVTWTYRFGADGLTDDDFLAYIERRTGRRQQRNVIARARGRCERDGYLVRVEDDLVVPGSTLSFLATDQAAAFIRGLSNDR